MQFAMFIMTIKLPTTDVIKSKGDFFFNGWMLRRVYIKTQIVTENSSIMAI
jgi:hypothetical protein